MRDLSIDRLTSLSTGNDVGAPLFVFFGEKMFRNRESELGLFRNRDWLPPSIFAIRNQEWNREQWDEPDEDAGDAGAFCGGLQGTTADT